MSDIIRPSKQVVDYYSFKAGCTITVDLILSSVLDKLAGYHISHSANILLNDLGFVTPKGKITKSAKVFAAREIHDRYHHNKKTYSVEYES